MLPIHHSYPLCHPSTLSSSLSLSLKPSRLFSIKDKKKMRRSCNLELRLFPLSDSDRRRMMEEEANESPQQQHQNQPLTIFYDGKICVCDVTEFQARSILMLASKEIMEERVRTPTSGSSEPSSPLLQSSKHNLNSPASSSAAAGTSLSMKRSLQRFLQKRKNRIQEASPYHLHQQKLIN